MAIIVEPLDDRVLVRPIEDAGVTKGGIHLPENAKEKPVKGVVISVGPGKKGERGERIQISVKKDDVVIYSKYAGTDIKVEDETLILLREADLVCKIREE